MFADYHVHSDYSEDCWDLMEDVVLDAIKKGLDEICFTDHVDYGVRPDWQENETYLVGRNKKLRNVHYKRYFKELKELTLKYADKISIKTGLEFGMQMHTISYFQKLYDSYQFDFILLSLHQVDDEEFWNGDFQKNRTLKECYDKYYDEMFNLVSTYQNYSVLAHVDVLRRYLNNKDDYFVYCKEKIEKILKVVILNNKGIEINTSSFRYKLNGLTPSYEILKLYYKLGGKIITIGSDSHAPEHLAFNILDAKKILKDIGFSHFCTFEKMNPIFHAL